MADQQTPCELVLVGIIRSDARWSADILQVAEEDDVKGAASLVQVAQEQLNSVDSM